MENDVLVNGELLLYGTVGEDLSFFGLPGFTPVAVIRALATLGRGADVAVRINSGGGFAEDGVAIYNALAAHRGKVTVFVDGIAGSAASVIAMAGDEVVMRRGALMMIHEPEVWTSGDTAEHTRSLDYLEHTAAGMADIYAQKTGRAASEIRTLMRDELWLSAEEAVAQKFADRLDAANANEPSAFNYRAYAKAPQRIVALADSRGWARLPRAATAALPADRAAAHAAGYAEGLAYAREVHALCDVAGVPAKAATFIAKDRPIAEVRREILGDRATATPPVDNGLPVLAPSSAVARVSLVERMRASHSSPASDGAAPAKASLADRMRGLRGTAAERG